MIRNKVEGKLGSYYFYDRIKDFEKLIVLPTLSENSVFEDSKCENFRIFFVTLYSQLEFSLIIC